MIKKLDIIYVIKMIKYQLISKINEQLNYVLNKNQIKHNTYLTLRYNLFKN